MTEMTDHELMQQALDALEKTIAITRRNIDIRNDAINSLRERLAQPAQQPVAWATHHDLPMLFPEKAEAQEYCDDDEAPIALYTHPQPAQKPCECRTCMPNMPPNIRMIVCAKCGNKRCPHANDHRNACTGSNDVGQPGSAYP